MRFNDTITIDDGADVRELADGRLVARPRIARTGIQLYLGRELGLQGDDASKVIRVYRSEKEVFGNDALASFLHRPVTNDHPPEPVTPENFSKYAKGWTGDEWARDGAFMRVPMMLADAGLIRDYKDGKRQLSNGYDCELDWTAGTSPEGEAFDCQQVTIRGNHVAVVDAARGGTALSIGDREQETERMSTEATKTTITVDSIPLQLDGMAASVIQAHLGRLDLAAKALRDQLEASQRDAKASKDALDAATATHTTTLAAKDTKIAELEKQVKDGAITPEKLDAMAGDRQKVIDVARVLLGDKLVVKDQTADQIKRQVVDARLGDKAKGWNDVQYTASFDALTVDVKRGERDNSIDYSGGGHRPGGPGPSVHDVAASFRQANPQSVIDKAYADRDAELSEAWKTPHKAA